MNKFHGILCILVSCSLLISCNTDPYDPPIGPRNFRPGATTYLSNRNDISASEKASLLNYQPCSLETLKLLWNAPSREVRSLVASNPSVDVEILEKLSSDKEPGVRQCVANSRNISHELLVKFKNDPDPNLKWALPGNPNWTADEIRQMYKDKATSTSVFAGNPSTPLDILEELSDSSDSNVTTQLANNPSISDAIIRKLIGKDNSSAKIMLTYNKATSIDVLKILAEDKNPDVKRYAEMYLEKAKSKR